MQRECPPDMHAWCIVHTHSDADLDTVLEAILDGSETLRPGPDSGQARSWPPGLDARPKQGYDVSQGVLMPSGKDVCPQRCRADSAAPGG